MIQIKNSADIEGMRAAGRVAANVLEEMVQAVTPGMSTYDLDQEASRIMQRLGAKSTTIHYKPAGMRPYPSYTCISVNDEIVHGSGRKDKILHMGDIVSLDVCVEYKGWVGDNCRTVPVGPISSETEKLLDVTRASMFKGIDMARKGNRIGDISNAVQTYVEAHHMGIVREFVGHGVGHTMHEEPQVPNFGYRGRGPRLVPGMTICIEPMVTLGSPSLKIANDGWLALTRDGKPAAHFEHTVLITEDEPEILTLSGKTES